MRTELRSRKVLATKWNASSAEISNWECGESIAILFAKTIPDTVFSGVSNAGSGQLNAGVAPGITVAPANKPVLRVLLVEDSRDDGDLICYQLEKCGYTTYVAQVYCEETMRAALERESWDIVLTDHVLPGFSGKSAIDLLHKMGRRIPIICITGSVDPAVIRQVLAAGVSACLNKGDLSLLCRAVERALNSNSRREINKDPHPNL